MGLHLGLGLTGQRVNASPASLFTVSGSRGFMYDLSDYGSQWQDTAGTVPITSTAQSVGLVLDQSQGLALGAELVTNGDFSNGSTGWTDASTAPATATVTGGELVLVSDGVARARFRSTQTTVAGRTYRVTFVVTSGTAEFNCGTTASGTEYFGLFNVGVGTYTRLVLATSGTMHIQVHKGVAGTGIADNVSVRELAGNHATQATAGNRPLTTTIGAGFRGIQFDGVDDWLQTAAIDFSNSDEVTVVAGVRKLSDAALGAVCELGIGGSAGSFGLGAPAGASATYRFLSGGSTPIVAATASAFPAPESAVITGLGDISGDSIIVRRNGAQVGSSFSDQGTGNFSNAIVYIGRRGGTSLPFNGVLTFLFAINRRLTANELASVEAYANARTGAY